MSRVHIIWFKRDLRIHDHAALNAACAAAMRDKAQLLPLYIVEPDYWALPEHSERQFDFVTDSLKDLDGVLKARGSGLHVACGDAVEVLSALHRTHGIASLHAHRETGLDWTDARNRAVESWCLRAGIPFRQQVQHGVVQGLKDRDSWAKRWHNLMAQPRLTAPETIPASGIPSPSWPRVSAIGLSADPCPQRQIGGRRAAITLLKSFNERRGEPYRRAMSSPLTAVEACSRLSPHLAYGTLSMRETWQAASAARDIHAADGRKEFAASLDSFISRLHWHCHFIQQFESEAGLEHNSRDPAFEGLRENPAADDANLLAWFDGNTGFPFVDACMRALRETGWLNFPMRAMVMSFASHHLWMHWKRPAEWLARRFTDFEPGIHYPQAQRQSGTGGTTAAQIYNPVKQSQEQDPDGLFIRQWVPELANLPTEFIHAPWTAPAHVLIESGVTLGSTYPQPIIDHVQAARQARSKINAAQRSEAAITKTAAKPTPQPRPRKPVTSFQKHRDRAAKRPAKRQAAQLSLDLEAPHPASNNLH